MLIVLTKPNWALCPDFHNHWSWKNCAVCVNEHSSDAVQLCCLTSGCLLILLVLSSKLVTIIRGMRGSCSVAQLRGIRKTFKWVAKTFIESISVRNATGSNHNEFSACFRRKTASQKFDSICSCWLWHHCACNTLCHSPAVINGVWRLPYKAGRRLIWVCHLLKAFISNLCDL